MLSQNFRIGTRKSNLALKQVDEVLEALKRFDPHIRADIKAIETSGDKDKQTPISDIEGTDFFTREIDEALLEGEIDLAVHSAKDLPDKIPEGLFIAAITESCDPYDALVSKKDLKLNDLPYKAKIGVSSQRRKTRLKEYRSDFQIIDIRGTIEERLDRFDKADLDAVVIASCALMRLGLGERITERIPLGILKPHPLQGALAIETRKNDSALIDFLSRLDSSPVRNLCFNGFLGISNGARRAVTV